MLLVMLGRCRVCRLLNLMLLFLLLLLLLLFFPLGWRLLLLLLSLMFTMGICAACAVLSSRKHDVQRRLLDVLGRDWGQLGQRLMMRVVFGVVERMRERVSSVDGMVRDGSERGIAFFLRGVVVQRGRLEARHLTGARVSRRYIEPDVHQIVVVIQRTLAAQFPMV